MTLVGLIGICDPPRYDVKDAISVIRRAGVRVFMITGDFRLTALAIARQVMR
jgi:sodium/potassium-transporting ATPase subunit alpha